MNEMEELKACPFCGGTELLNYDDLKATSCGNKDCDFRYIPILISEWQSRPKEVELERKIAELNEIIIVLQLQEQKIKQKYNDEVQQFNDGYEAAKAGLPEDEYTSYEVDYDQWLPGYAWGKYEILKKQVEVWKECFDKKESIYARLLDDYMALKAKLGQMVIK